VLPLFEDERKLSNTSLPSTPIQNIVSGNP